MLSCELQVKRHCLFMEHRMRLSLILLAGISFATPAFTQTKPAATPVAAATPTPKPLDWPQLNRYRADNAALPPPAAGENRVVFFGDSITDNWGHYVGTFFPGKPYVNRGISGQTTPQMLIRFEPDVVALHPAVVVILAGTNDIAGNTGPSTPEMIEDNFRAMTAIARQNGIKVVLASITPAARYPWSPTIQPVAIIREVNQWLHEFCIAQHLVYLDYYSALADESGAMKPGLSSDGVHPTVAGYAVMAPLAETAIAQALAQK
jgi:lysophospholipase L1-like esterase